MKSLGERLKIERERLKLSQSAFGEAGGVEKLAQINYEKDRRKPDADYLNRLAKLGVDILYVVTGDRAENAATTPIELSYLRLCRAFPDNSARMVGNAALIGILSTYSNQMNTLYVATNDVTVLKAAQNVGEFKNDE
jgi:transcriptional regulator with XRE-family HTH domain